MASNDLGWDKVVADFRRVCVLKRDGRVEDSDALLNQELSASIAAWSQASGGDAAAKRLRLQDMFVAEERRVEDAWMIRGWLVPHLKEEIVRELRHELAAELTARLESELSERLAARPASAALFPEPVAPVPEPAALVLEPPVPQPVLPGMLPVEPRAWCPPRLAEADVREVLVHRSVPVPEPSIAAHPADAPHAEAAELPPSRIDPAPPVAVRPRLEDWGATLDFILGQQPELRTARAVSMRPDYSTF